MTGTIGQSFFWNIESFFYISVEFIYIFKFYIHFIYKQYLTSDQYKMGVQLSFYTSIKPTLYFDT